MATDPWKDCLRDDMCTHDLARGALTADLLGGDDPDYNPLDQPLISPGAAWMAAAMTVTRSPATTTSRGLSSRQ